MKRIALFLLMILAVLGTAVHAGYKCEECPQGAGCVAYEPAGDGCNTATYAVWCTDGKWYRGDSFAFTLVYCLPKDRPTAYPWTPPDPGGEK